MRIEASEAGFGSAERAIAVANGRPMRLAIIGNQAFSMVNFRGPLISALTARGVEVFALAPGLQARDEDAIRALGATPVRYRLNPTGISPLEDFAAAVQLYRALRTIRPDKVLAFTVKPVVFGTLAAWLAGVPKRYALIEGLGRLFVDTAGDRYPVLQRTVFELYRLALRRPTKTLLLNRDDKTDLVARGLVADASAEVIGGIGVDLQHWQPAPPVRDPVTFLFAGRLLEEKGVREFIEAARRIRRQRPDVRFVVLGDTEKRRGTVSDAEVQRAVAAGLIEWPGHVPVQPWLTAASVFVLPSYYREGVPRSIQEAMAMGRAVITTDTPGCRDTVIDGQSGLLIPPRDTDALVEAMLHFVRDPEQIAQMGRRSRELAEARFDVHVASARILRALGI